MSTPPLVLDEKVRAKVDAFPLVKSLLNIETVLSVLSGADEILTSDIAQIILDDPILTARLLRLANSGLFPLNQEVSSIEQVVALLGLNNIRELFLASPIIEEIDKLHRKNPKVTPTMLHQHSHHSLGAAIITRDIISYINVGYPPEADYLIGLLHNIGRVVIDLCYPEAFPPLVPVDEEGEDQNPAAEALLVSMEERDVLEQEIIGNNYAEIGAYYLSRHNFPEEIVNAICLHCRLPKTEEGEEGEKEEPNLMALALGLGIQTTLLLEKKALGSGFIKAKAKWETLESWKILFNPEEEPERTKAKNLKRRLLNRAYKFEL